ncbi:MAG TPA: branched-chain amino acid ABC transporter permease [Clostridia bacterium]|nr:branched-chain amino acid ABC transporter permease [Clostridia bacterium]
MANVLNWAKKRTEIFLIPLLFLLLSFLSKEKVLDSYLIQIIMLGFINVMMTESLNILNGMTGLSSLGHAGFMAVGAYSAAYVTSVLLNTSAMPAAAQTAIFLGASLLAGLVAAFCGLLIGFPTLRLRGDYLAIVTLGFCEVIRALMRIIKATGGAMGLTGIPQYSSLLFVFAFMIIAIYICRNFMDSSFGRACMAIRENEIAASTMGINVSRYKVIAFITSAFIAGVAGSLYAHLLRYLHPDVFSYSKSTDFLVYLYAGGVGSISGAMMGGFLLTLLPELLRFMSEWRLVIYGALLLCIILFRPVGLFGGKELAFLKLKTGGVKAFGFSSLKNLGKNRKKKTAATEEEHK